MLVGKRILRLWVARAQCAIAGHAWMRARRLLGNAGTQRCRKCAVVRSVTLRARKQPA